MGFPRDISFFVLFIVYNNSRTVHVMFAWQKEREKAGGLFKSMAFYLLKYFASLRVG